MFIKRILPALFYAVALSLLQAQEYKIHSHNDYLQDVPFWSALANGLNSIEVDILLKNDTLYATHGEADIRMGRTIENLYLQPLQTALSLGLGSDQEIQLLVDIKSEAHATMKKLLSVLEQYPGIIESSKVSIVISGNRPRVDEYANYPDHIKFDYQSLESPNPVKAWEKIALISLDFKTFSDWNGKGRFTAEDYQTLKEVIDTAHGYGKPFRFWGAPDSKTAWKAFTALGVDFINTDDPYAAASYVHTLDQRTYHNTVFSQVYAPTYASDQRDTPVKNIILLIGDGNGLTQITSSALANGGELTLTRFKSIGLLKTQSADDLITDSAAAGTALATGRKTNNRSIGVGPDGQPLLNISELLGEHGYNSGCITTDNIAGATPASFYAHREDRDDINGILADLAKSKLSLLVGGAPVVTGKAKVDTGFTMVNTLEAVGQSTEKRVSYYISEGEVPGITEGRKDVLAVAVKNGLAFLTSNKTPFFLMVEGAKIDSYGHENVVSGIVSEGIDFDRAVTEAVKFADTSGNTLVIVTADHETSGFSILQGDLEDKVIEGDFTTHDHTGTMVPIFAYGPQSYEFEGVYENAEVFRKILKVLDLGVIR